MQDNGLGQGVGKDGIMFGETLLIGSLADVDHGEMSEIWIDIVNEFSPICCFFVYLLTCTLFIES